MGEAGHEKVARNYEAKKLTRALEEIFETFYDKKVRSGPKPKGTNRSGAEFK